MPIKSAPPVGGPDIRYPWPVIIAVSVVLTTIAVYVGLTPPPRDNSDPVGGRSNMAVLTDALTGCQYLATQRGSITPRMDANGKQICNKASINE